MSIQEIIFNTCNLSHIHCFYNDCKLKGSEHNYTPTHREGAILQSRCPSVHTFVTDISASPGRNDFIFDIWLWHGDLYRVSPFQVYRTSTSCLQWDLEFFMFAIMKTFVTVISASTGRNDFIFDIWLWHGDLYHVSPLSRFTAHLLPVYRATYKWTSGGILSTT